MIPHQIALLKRELWEHRSIYITPAVISIIVVLGALATIVFASGFAEELHLAIFGASNIAGEAERQSALVAMFLGFVWLFMLAATILTVFYCLDALYSERKDKSILFWRSLPITDAESVISKLLTAILVIPAVTIVAVMLTHLVTLVMASIWISMLGGDAGHLIWGSVPLFDNWSAALIVMIASALWMSPFIGWFLFVSAISKRMPLLIAFLPMFVLPLAEFIFLRTTVFAETVLGRGDHIPLFRSIDFESFFDESEGHLRADSVDLLTYIDLGKFFTSPSVWIGFAACGILVFAAIYVRRYRDESY